MAAPILEVENLYKNFGDLEVLKGVSFTVSEGESVSLIGSSGSGKSTLLRCVNFLEMPDEGIIRFLQHEVPWKVKTFREKRNFKRYIRGLREEIGIVFQDFNLWPHKTVLENIIEAPIYVKGTPREEAVRDAEKLLNRYGLEDKRDVYPTKLSGGQKQRVAIIRSLAMKPKLILFDEVTSALDPELTAEVLKAIEILASDGMTMILVTHEIDFAVAASRRTIFIDGGVIVEEGPSADVLKNPQMDRTKQFLRKVLRED